MNHFSKQDTKSLLQKYKTQPIKRFGQNFLIDKSAINKIIEVAEISPNDIVLEIGPGTGALTQELAKRAKKVIAVEKDIKMIEILEETLKDFNNIEIIQGDALKMADSQVISPYKVVGNLPFYLTAPIIRQFLETENPPKEMTLIVQKEVGQRICAKPPRMSILAVSVQIYAEPKIISYISKKSFWPSPKVDSAIIKILKINSNQEIDRDLFFKIVKAGFSQPRKQLINNLSKGMGMEKEKTEKWILKNKIEPSQRAETLSIDDWLKLLRDFLKN
ncbi:MAG: 16S rRNA (adenine(1518)-N(6)/adenine(1519)-N(6))-dimethyltransferase RsmA [Candidatus Nealsonbacteria bacterium]|nr:16S rRNA (adenine(1518)-N(6)/adenine(1519)-N(6))-dimethyltransferase RsmA [Candidatus Nealsonbacteria bacterium]